MQKLLVSVVAIVALLAGVVIFNSLPRPEPQALVYEPPRELDPFMLEAHNGAQLTNADLTGQWTFLFTGYTSCPDICPTTMADFKKALPQLASVTNRPVKVWLISVDPRRDTQQKLADYTTYFGTEFMGVRAEHKNLYPFVNGLGLMYSIPGEEEVDYLVNHSSAIVLVNPDGNRHAIFKASHTPGTLPTVDMEQMVQDFQLITQQYQ
ncbi:SCO family protein [Pseudidiomarina terrestris]|uniref:SCO family protein n=1 Tax=Pseudidiomarina terrestris TaxID=2820060 RepID=UPI00264BF7A0|nr:MULTISPECIES: SCO family protein [unclassified Pseudidiomarina]MDN7126181.1 SCO family protein [Pseudidiomarina sp. 1APR75-33.1]MDN7134206.1 SCO family protein [Pseudidiomarina sp. 1ASP75-5]MDN7137106.1 SCO family protein [Pseudidiomarina sp. 1ASP75-14]